MVSLLWFWKCSNLQGYSVKLETDIKQTGLIFYFPASFMGFSWRDHVSELYLLYSFETTEPEEELSDQIDMSCFPGTLRWDDTDNGRNCWKKSDGSNFKVRSKSFASDKSKVSCAFCMNRAFSSFSRPLIACSTSFRFMFIPFCTTDSWWEASYGSCSSWLVKGHKTNGSCCQTTWLCCSSKLRHYD